MRRIYLSNYQKKDKHILIFGKDFHYLKNILRLKKNSQFKAFDGNKSEYLLQIEKIQSFIKARILEIAHPIQKKPAISIEFCPCLCKMKVFESMIEKASELGVVAIKPIITSRSLHTNPEQSSSRIERWKKIIAEGRKISGEIKIPEIYPVKTLDKILLQPGLNIFFWEQSPKNLKQIMPLIKQQLRDKKIIKIFIGPEGGFTDEEVELAEKNHSFIAGLGQRILRVETAAIAAISILSYQLDDDG